MPTTEDTAQRLALDSSILSACTAFGRTMLAIKFAAVAYLVYLRVGQYHFLFELFFTRMRENARP